MIKIATQAERDTIYRMMDDAARELVTQHRLEMIAVVKNKGVKEAYKAYQTLLPYSYRIQSPAIIPKSYMTFQRDWLWRKEAKHLHKLKRKLQDLFDKDEELKTAYEQYKVIVGLTK